MKARGTLRWLGRAADRLSDNWLFDLATGTWFDRPIDNYLDRRKTVKPPRRRVYLDADGNEIPDPEAPASP